MVGGVVVIEKITHKAMFVAMCIASKAWGIVMVRRGLAII
jgi:hypothetical protein